MLSPMDRSRSFLSFVSVLLFASSLVPVALATIISTFTDDNCRDSYKSFPGPNGFPNGTCTHLNEDGDFGSFQVVQEDVGCGVTIYGNDSVAGSPCSATLLQLADIATCYNSSWVYFSIDYCTPPSSSTSSSSSTATTSAKSSTSTNGSSGNHAGAIAGGVIGGIAGVVLIVVLAWFLWLRRRRQGQTNAAPPEYKGNERLPQELPSSVPMTEMPTAGTAAKYELHDDGQVTPIQDSPPKTQFYAELPAHQT